MIQKIIIGNTILTLLYLVIMFFLEKRKEKRNYEFIFRGMVMLLCPVFGMVMYFLGYVIFRVIFHKPVDLADVIFNKDRVVTYSYADEENERNLVPLEDAIMISDKGDLRKLMMNVVRGEVDDSLATIAMALNSEDSETAHYAAAVLQEALNTFRTSSQKGYRMVTEEGQYELEDVLLLLEYMNATLVQKVFTDTEQKTFVQMMDEIGSVLYDEAPKEMGSSIYEMLAMRLLEVQDYQNCEKWCMRSKEQYPDTLSSFTCYLKLYFTTEKKDLFFRELEQLRNSDVVIDKETLELIRVFL